MQSLMQDAKGFGKTKGIFVKVDSKAVNSCYQKESLKSWYRFCNLCA